MNPESPATNTTPEDSAPATPKPYPENSGKKHNKSCNNCGFCTSLWSKTYHGLGFLGIGVILGLLLILLSGYFRPDIVSFKDTTIHNPNQFDMIIKSYQATITSYNNALFAIIGLFSLLSIGTFVINRSAADKIDTEYKNIREKYFQANKEYRRTLKATDRYKKSLKKILADIQQQANEEIKNIKKESSKERSISQQLADAYAKHKKGNPDTALEICNAVIRSYPGSYDAYNLQGIILNKTGEHKEAIECYDKALEINPEYAEAYNNKGIALQDLKEYKKAIQCYDKALEINPEYAEPHSNKGIALQDLKEYKKAIQCYDKALEINPKYSTYYSKGIALQNLKEYKKAIQCYDKALEINPEYADAYNNKGIALQNLKEYKKAIQCYDKALEINPKDAGVYNNKGIALQNLKEYKKAIQCYDKALEINPKDAGVYNNKGIALQKLNEYNKAIECYDKAIAINPEYADAYNNKGIALQKLNEYNKAIECYDKAIAINPEYTKAYINKGVALNYLNKFTEALEYLTTAANLDHNIPINYNLACTYALWHNSSTEPKDRPADCLALCRHHLELALKSGELQKLGIDQVKKDPDLQSLQQEDWFNAIMRQAFGAAWDDYTSPEDTV